MQCDLSASSIDRRQPPGQRYQGTRTRPGFDALMKAVARRGTGTVQRIKAEMAAQ